MLRLLAFCAITILFFPACQKELDVTAEPFLSKDVATITAQYIQYNIAAGEQYCDKNFYQAIELDELNFKVKFDSSCIYKTIDPNNQYDINKLFGFSDNNTFHHDFSARFGWRWSNDSLRLFAYIYNNSIRDSKELGTVPIGVEQSCSIKVTKEAYLFTLNGKTEVMPRKSTTPKAEGYKLYPYFGGDELAPHAISIYIKQL